MHTFDSVRFSFLKPLLWKSAKIFNTWIFIDYPYLSFLFNSSVETFAVTEELGLIMKIQRLEFVRIEPMIFSVISLSVNYI